MLQPRRENGNDRISHESLFMVDGPGYPPSVPQ